LRTRANRVNGRLQEKPSGGASAYRNENGTGNVAKQDFNKQFNGSAHFVVIVVNRTTRQE